MVSSSAVLSAITLLVACATTSVKGHGYIRQPLVAFKGGSTNSAWIQEDKTPWTGFSSWSTYTSDFAKISKQKGFSTLRSFLENKGAACGYTDPNTTPRSIPSDGNVIYQHNDIGFVHPGPCELWLDDKMVMHNDDCQKGFPGSKAVMPVDFSSCKGSSCMLRMYWLAFQDKGDLWQTYKYCVPVSGSSKSSSNTSGNEADSSATTTTKASSSKSSGNTSGNATVKPAGGNSSGSTTSKKSTTKTSTSSNGSGTKKVNGKRLLRNE